MIAVFAGLLLLSVQSQPVSVKAETVSFQHRDLALGGVLYRPEGPGPFPAVLYNHGSAPGNLNDQAFEQLGPLFVQRGWVFFAPYRRGQGLSSSAGPYIGDVIRTARNRHAGLVALGALPIVLVFLVISRKQRLRLRVLWALVLGTGTALAMQLISSRAGAEAMVRALENEHLSDQLAALEWLNKQEFVVRSRIATAGNSFGGVEVMLGAARASYCAGVVGSGGAESWATTPQLREVMARAARGSKAPIFFF
ncbi:MAG TPA: prolyl oligopeptidase family serine peptidase, partial [Gemmatimonadales bacterium]|nr:prolyl oligopeptidase family serine peptidase [Gemmatimonadales bacterium]